MYKLCKKALLGVSCLLLPALALASMENSGKQEEDQTKPAVIIAEQNRESASTLWGTITKAQTFQEQYTKYYMLKAELNGLLGQKDVVTDNTLLPVLENVIQKKTNKFKKCVVALQTFYDDYKTQCEEKNFDPEHYTLKGTPYAFLAQNLSAIIYGLKAIAPQPDNEVSFELDKLFHRAFKNSSGLIPPFPVHPYDLLQSNDFFVGKYRGYVDERFKNDAQNFEKLSPELQILLKEVGHIGVQHLARPEILSVFTRLFMKIDIKKILPSNSMYHYGLEELYRDPLIEKILSMHRERWALGMKGLIHRTEMSFWPAAAENYTNCVQELTKYFSFMGKTPYIFPSESEALDQQLSIFLNLLDAIYSHEWSTWQEKQKKIEDFQRSYEKVMNALVTEDGKNYLSVLLDDYNVVLLPATKGQQSADRKELASFIEERKAQYDQEIAEYFNIKPFLPAIQKMVDWFQEVKDVMRRSGRVS